MKHLLTLGLALGSAAALAQTPITITPAQFTATAGSVDRYQPTSVTGVANPATGTNKTWDYRTLTPQGLQSVDTYNNAGATPPFASSVRYFDFYDGSLGILAAGYEGFDTDGFGQLGKVVATAQTFPLGSVTGTASDNIVVPAQTIAMRTLRVPLPMTSTSRTVRTSRFALKSTFTIMAFGLSQVPFRQVTRITSVDSVAGWGTLRIPVAGSQAGSVAMPVLLGRRRVIQQDSFYLNGQPAPAALLTGLGLTQGGFTYDFRYRFFRQNSGQPVLTFLYADSRFTTPTDIAYSTESTILLGTQAAREVAAGGLLAWPNPAAAGQPLQFSLGTSTSGQPLRISLRDATGRVVAQVTATNGQPTTLPPLPTGLYLAETEAADGTRASRRLVLE
ncbi:MAG: T9SS type A sorting domain-containing protein [Janthinobacterium lividum]